MLQERISSALLSEKRPCHSPKYENHAALAWVVTISGRGRELVMEEAQERRRGSEGVGVEEAQAFVGVLERAAAERDHRAALAHCKEMLKRAPDNAMFRDYAESLAALVEVEREREEEEEDDEEDDDGEEDGEEEDGEEDEDEDEDEDEEDVEESGGESDVGGQGENCGEK